MYGIIPDLEDDTPIRINWKIENNILKISGDPAIISSYYTEYKIDKITATELILKLDFDSEHPQTWTFIK